MSELLLFLHVLFAMTWLGGSIYIEALMAGARRTGDGRTWMRTFLRVGDTNQRLFTVAGIGTILFGFWLVFDRAAYEFEQAWVVLAIVMVLISVGLGVFYLTPRSQQIADRVAENGLEDPEAVSLAKQVVNVAHLNVLLLLIALVMMIWKPGF
jgi:uncharacterized membrane protein